MKKNELIEIREGGAGPHAYVGRTRIRVVNIAIMYNQILDELIVERIAAQYPQLSHLQIHAAIEYSREHPEEMEQEQAADEAAFARLPDVG